MQNLSNKALESLSKEDLQTVLASFQQQHQKLIQEHEALRKSHDHYALIYHYSGVGYLTLDKNGTIRNANVAAEHLFGCYKESIINKNLSDFIYPEELSNYHAFIAAAIKQKENQRLTFKLNNQVNNQDLPLDLKQPHADSSNNTDILSHRCTYLDCQQTINNKYQANDLQLHLTVNDITEYKSAQKHIIFLNEQLNKKVLEQSGEIIASSQKLLKKVTELHHSQHLLQEREARLNSIFDAAVEGIITIDANGNIIAINASISNIFGYSKQELIGKSVIKLMPQPKSNLYRRVLKKYLERHIPKIIGQISEIEGSHKNGTIIPIDFSVSTFSIETESYVTCIVRDASSRKAQELQDKVLLDELAHVTRLGLMGEMASGIAHEINQPLSAIANYTQACINFMHNDHPDMEQLSNVLLKTQQQALSAGQIIHRMRDFVKFKTIHDTQIEINSLVQTCIDLCSADLKQHNIVQRFELSDNLPLVSIDSVQIQQVLINLIRNAVDALKTLPSTTRRHLSIHTTLNPEQAIEIRVKDNGPGIEDLDQKKILTPFFTTKTDGMGMGLAICHSIIKAHQGSLHFNSLINKGTTFYFTLPFRNDHDAHKSAK